MVSETEEKKSSWLELTMVLLTGVGHVTLELLSDGMTGAAASLNRPQQIYNLAACGGWSVYLFWRFFHGVQAGREWGLRRTKFWTSLRESLMFAMPAAFLLLLWGYWHGHLPLPRTFWMVLFMYPAWGIAQQFALQVLITRNLRQPLPSPTLRAMMVATLFSLAHFPNWWLMALVFPAGLAFTWVFERHRNLWAIGIVHGLLGSLAYYLILGKDPGAELIKLIP